MSIGLIVGLAIIAILVIFTIVSYNNLVSLRNNAKEGFSTMDVYLKKRFDLIPNLVETVKGYVKHESTTLDNVVEARSKVAQSNNANEQIEAENMLSDTLKSLFAISENYPDLKANQNFIDLQNQLNQIETDIANARKYYNGAVKELNNACEMFPSVIIAKIFNFEKMPMYKVTTEAERENVKVDF